MASANAAQMIASQQEYMKGEITVLYESFSRLWKFFEERTDVPKPVSNRPVRIPFDVLNGGIFQSANLDGPSLGRGSGSTQVFGSLSCVSFSYAMEWSALTEYASDSTEKAVIDYVTEQQAKAGANVAAYMDALVAYGDGANTLDTVVSTTPGGIVVNNANAFQDNQPVDVWSGIGGTLRGTVNILSVDQGNNTIWISGTIPAGTTAGDYLLVSKSAGIAGSGLAGLSAYNVGGNTGSFMTIPRSSYAGKFSTPYQSVNGTVTPASVRAFQGLIKLAMGIDSVKKAGLKAHTGLEIQAAWENQSLLVQQVIVNENKQDISKDMLAKNAVSTIGGEETILNERARPGRIDWISPQNWGRIETKKLGFYELPDGQHVFPSYGGDGGVGTTMLSYLVWIGQVGSFKPRMNGVQNNITIPKGWFGH